MNRIRKIDVLVFFLMAFILVWWRAHTYAPRIEQLLGLKFWAEMSGATEPLDCDEAAYGYMARRMASGAVLYRDLTEYKPPGGYWFYALAIAIAGASELTVRLMILPVLLATLGLVGSIAGKLSGTLGAVIAMAVFVLVSTDPYVFGNGSNLEHLMNLACTAGVWAFIKAFESSLEENRSGAAAIGYLGGKMHGREIWLFVSGCCIGLAATVKQVALIALFPILFEFARSKSMAGRKRLGIGMTLAGFLIPWVVVFAILAGQGALADARADVFEYSRALAAETPADANAPAAAIRWLTGNSDPRNGALPWPFGQTDWLVWWGTGAWPMHALAATVFFACLVYRPARATPASRVVLWQYPLAWGMIALPGLFWQHYYLLLAPVTSLLVGSLTGFTLQGSHLGETDDTGKVKTDRSRPLMIPHSDRAWREMTFTCLMLGILLLIGMTARIQWLDFFTVPADMLTVKYKGGAQWVSLRQLGREMKERTRTWQPRPILEVWGWQSPLLFYSGLDAPDRYFFTDPLAKSNVGKSHPLVRPRIERLTKSLIASRPELIFCGDIPFPELKSMLARDYIASSLVGSTPDGRGLFVRKDKYQDFHARIVPDDTGKAARP